MFFSFFELPARRSLTVATAQFLSRPTIKENTEVIISFIERAAKAGAQVVSFHETATTGYSAKIITARGTHEALRECERAICSACRKHVIACIVGTAHFSERSGETKNTALVVDERGRCVCRQSKIQLVQDDHWAVPGRTLNTFQVAGVECCAVICVGLLLCSLHFNCNSCFRQKHLLLLFLCFCFCFCFFFFTITPQSLVHSSFPLS